jgi:hypothetical protein
MRKHQVHSFGLWTALSAIVAFVLLLGAALAASRSPLAGDWQGALETGNGSLRVVIHIVQAKDDSLTGTLDSPDQGATGIAISSISYNQPDFHFEIARIGSSYAGRINNDKTEISGQWAQGDTSLSLSFKRVDNRE